MREGILIGKESEIRLNLAETEEVDVLFDENLPL